MTLYQIDAAIAAWEPETDENGEVTNLSALDELDMERGKKLENVALRIKNLSTFAADLKAEELSLRDRREKVEREAEWLRGYLQLSLNGEAMETPRCKVSYVKSTRVFVEDESILPPELMTEKVTRKPNKELIKKLLTAGQSVVGCRLETVSNLQLK